MSSLIIAPYTMVSWWIIFLGVLHFSKGRRRDNGSGREGGAGRSEGRGCCGLDVLYERRIKNLIGNSKLNIQIT